MTANHKRVNGNGKDNGKQSLSSVNGRYSANGGNGHKGMELLAKTLYRELKKSGYDLGQILDFSGKLIGYVHTEVASKDDTN